MGLSRDRSYKIEWVNHVTKVKNRLEEPTECVNNMTVVTKQLGVLFDHV